MVSISRAINKYSKILNAFANPKGYYIYQKKDYLHHNLSFSQEGEDLLLHRIFEGKKTGFYIDVGAHHPQRFSNTYLFYLKGWRGINIDASPGSMDLFKKRRPEDINVEAAISSVSETLTYYIFNEPALNGFLEKLSTSRNESGNYKIVHKIPIRTKTLSEILDQYLRPGQVIDFLSVDVEGLDYEVLVSNDWSKYKPKIVLAEELSASLDRIYSSSKIDMFLKSIGYELFSKTMNTSFYKLTSI